MAERKLFGTDGIRGIANVEPMTSETVLRLGRAVAHVFRRQPRRHQIVIGKDTRLSGYMLETALASGICSMGVDVLLVGPMPTPAIAFLTRSMRADAGAVISASHNAFPDNGIKFFAANGFKLPDDIELEIEGLVLEEEIDHLRPTATEIGKARRVDDALGRYNAYLKSTFPRSRSLEGLRIAIDCANGSGYRVGPEVLEELGASVVRLSVDPDGENINHECGALHPETLAAHVRREGCDLGIALDGDADRTILVDERGEIVDGDAMLAIAAREMIETDGLAGGVVVTTVMSNLGLDRAITGMGGHVARTPVGDRYVVEEMLRLGANLGGEPSGHVVFLDHSTTGDGLLTALVVLAAMVERERPLSALAGVFQRYPQVLVNVSVSERQTIEEIPAVQRAVQAAEEALAGDGRVVVRYSGTELLARVMVEGSDETTIRRWADEIASAFPGLSS